MVSRRILPNDQAQGERWDVFIFGIDDINPSNVNARKGGVKVSRQKNKTPALAGVLGDAEQRAVIYFLAAGCLVLAAALAVAVAA
jgi:hypothetical protein